MKSMSLFILGLTCFFVSAKASALGFNCRNEDPHIIAELFNNQNLNALEGTVIVGFVHGTIKCPRHRVSGEHGIKCSGEYQLASKVELFRAFLELRTNYIATLSLPMPSMENQENVPVTCLQN